MPNSESISCFPLRIVAADEGTEIFLVDSSFSRIASAVGELHENVPPGIYKARFRSGDTMADQLFEVPAELPPYQNEILVEGKPLPFASPIPLPDTRTSHEYHQRAWNHARDVSDIALGTGSWLFVLARDVEKKPGKRANHVPWHGLALCDLDGRVLYEFSRAPFQDADLGYVSANIELNPATYILRVDTELNGILEMPLVTSPGWQTQVALRSRTIRRRNQSFSESEGPRRTRSVRRADLSGATVLMCRPGYSADPTGKQDRLTELARLGLIQGRSTIRPEDLRSMLWTKFENPMLGIYGAHLLLQADKQDMVLLQEVIGNLESMLGQHPDVEALRLTYERNKNGLIPPGMKFDKPTMLARSWDMVVEASLDNPEIVPDGSFSAKVAANLVTGSHWLIWRRTSALSRALSNRESGYSGFPPDAFASTALLKEVLEPMQSNEGISGDHHLSYLALHPLMVTDGEHAKPSGKLPKKHKPKEQEKKRQPSMGQATKSTFTPMQSAVLHEIDAVPEMPSNERIKQVARNLRLPLATVNTILDSLLNMSRN